MYEFPGLRPRSSESVCLGKAANLLLNKHFLVSLSEGSEKQGRVSKHVLCGCRQARIGFSSCQHFILDELFTFSEPLISHP